MSKTDEIAARLRRGKGYGRIHDDILAILDERDQLLQAIIERELQDEQDEEWCALVAERDQMKAALKG